jgi:hypothetical protein
MKKSMKGLEDNFKLVKDGSAVIEKGMAAATKAGDAVFLEKISPFAAAFGYIFFHEVVSPTTWIGATIIFLSNLYIIRREHKLKRTQGAPVVKM